MKVLGIESSCDETAAAVVENGTVLISNVINSQIDIHAVYGGVVPEVAARSHLEVILPVIDKALSDAFSHSSGNSNQSLVDSAQSGKMLSTDTYSLKPFDPWDQIDAIAVTYAPGLVGSLLIGSLAARTLALLKNKPLYPIHHVEAHVYANFIRINSTQDSVVSKQEEQSLATENWPLTTTPEFPILALIVSGGHSQLVLFKSHGDYELLGQTQDDAVGEALDKVAKIIGLPYPGGPSIAKAAEAGDPLRFKFPKARMKNAYDFSFSGLKTAVLRTVQSETGVAYDFPSHQLPQRVSDALRADVAASFQHIAIETLVDKAEKAYHDYSPASVVIAGGVAANQELREQLSARLPLTIEYAPMNLCTDNAAMIASLGYFYALENQPADPRSVEVIPSLSMTKTAWATHKMRSSS